jgi:hypothetical protein
MLRDDTPPFLFQLCRVWWQWPMGCLFTGMIDRFMLILAGLVVAGLVGSFLLYVSALALLTSIAMVLGLIATLALGFWAGLNSTSQTPGNTRKGKTVQVINTTGDVTFLPEVPAVSMKRETGLRIVTGAASNR